MDLEDLKKIINESVNESEDFEELFNILATYKKVVLKEFQISQERYNN